MIQVDDDKAMRESPSTINQPAEPVQRTNRSLLVLLIDLLAQQRRDDAVKLSDLKQRDRAIGMQLQQAGQLSPKSNPRYRLARWLDHAWPPPEVDSSELSSTDSPGEKLATALRLGTILVTLLGLVLGYLTILGLLNYDGSQPINIFTLLAAYIVVHSTLLALTLLIAIGGTSRFAFAIQGFSPGRLALAITRWLPRDLRETVDEFKHTGRHLQGFAGIQKWLVFSLAQSFAVGFHLAALLGALQLIFFSDLAFGWSTTLDINPATFASIVQSIALPWSFAWEAARPSAELVEASQFTRAEATWIDSAETSGGWWPFVVMLIAIYGLIPRLALLFLGLACYRTRTAQAIDQLPQTPRILKRLDAALVQTLPPPPTQTDEAFQSVSIDSELTQTKTAVAPSPIALHWANAAPDHTSDAKRYSVGGNQSLAEDERILTEITATEQEHETITLYVKGYEPPTGELTDFVKALREALQPNTAIDVVMHYNQPPDATKQQCDQQSWQRWQQQLKDQWVQLRMQVTTSESAETVTDGGDA